MHSSQLPRHRRGFPVGWRLNVFAAAVWLAAAAMVGRAAPASASAANDVDFSRDIRPLLNKHCTPCHGGVKKAGNVSFLFREKALSAGKSGAIPIVPGEPEKSEAIKRLVSADDDERMPPPKHGPPLPEREVALLRDWVRQGARWDGHWAYSAPRSEPMPAVANTAWCRQSIDRYILGRLEAEKLEPSPEADRVEWLRRVTFDLTGLPPTAAEIVAFLADREPGSYERVVDGLLGSPHFGERWAAVWMDLARYADSQGYEKDAARVVWPWRDWLIRAFNRDLPFDQFTVRLLAGDLLPDATLEDVIGSAFHRNTPTNAEGGTDDEEYRVAAVLDRVSTTWKTWMGVSFHCVQCHAHPYDPFEQPEFYRFAAFFNTSQDWDLTSDEPKLPVPVDTAEFEKARGLDRELHRLRQARHDLAERLGSGAKAWRTLAPVSAMSSHMTRLVVRPLAEGGGEVVTEGTVSHDSRFTIEFTGSDGMAPVTALRIDASPRHPERAALTAELGFVLSEVRAQVLSPANEAEVTAHEKNLAAAREAESAAAAAEQKAGEKEKEAARKETEARRREVRELDRRHPGEVRFIAAIGDEVDAFTDARFALDPDSRGWGPMPRMTHPRHLVLVPEKPLALGAGSKLRLLIRQEAAPNDMAPLVMNRSRFSVASDPAWIARVSAPEFREREERIVALEKERGAIKSAALPVMAEQESPFRRPTAVFVRGDWLSKGDRVEPAVPKLFPQIGTAGTPDRLAMANWIVSPENPLTARVAVNRIWDQVFGIGLVESVDDFGTSGQPPSHPALLDHLALHFRDDLGWSVKKLLRELVLSSTYRQSSIVREPLRTRDPQNRLLARGPRTRLTAEMIRDNALAVSGLLSPKLYGPPVMPVQPDGIWRVVYSSQKWETSTGEDAHRRALYTYWRRSTPYPSLVTFDAPNRLVCNARRVATSTPLQALVTLNDPVFMECARALGRRMSEEGGVEPAGQVSHGFRLATGRAASREDVADLLALHARAREAYRNDPSLAAKLGAEPEAAALAMVANALLNLDAVLTK